MHILNIYMMQYVKMTDRSPAVVTAIKVSFEFFAKNTLKFTQ